MDKPVRINLYLATLGLCSRREADVLIARGLVTINGRKAKLGDKVNPGDKVELKDKKPEAKYYVAYHKPIGVVTHTPVDGETEISDVFKFKVRLSPVGRLDKNSHGLIILTNDGRVVKNLLSPEAHKEKEYLVRVDERVTPGFLRRLAEGMPLEDGERTKPAKTQFVSDKSFRIVLTEGKHHQIRRMCAISGYRVLELCRTRIMDVRLGSLKSGEGRELKDAELKKFLKNLGIDQPTI
jgi:23S rRNA pseudouridine2604 synthase